MQEKIGAIFSVLLMLVGFVGVLALAYYSTKLIGKRYSGQGFGEGNIKILDKVILGQDKSLMIVQVEEKTMLIGCTQHHIEKLSDLDAEKLNIKTVQEAPLFSQTFKTVLKTNLGIVNTKGQEKKENPDNERL